MQIESAELYGNYIWYFTETANTSHSPKIIKTKFCVHNILTHTNYVICEGEETYIKNWPNIYTLTQSNSVLSLSKNSYYMNSENQTGVSVKPGMITFYD